MQFTLRICLILTFLIQIAETAKGRNEDSNLRSFRNYMLDEVNYVRTRPADYAEKRLKEEKEEGTDNGAYKQLKKVKPVKPLKFNKTLNSIAMEYARYMAKRDKFSHTANGTPFSRAKKAGYRYTAMGENIACGSDPQLNALINPKSSAIEFVKMLIIDEGVKDLGHRQALLNPVFKSIGIGFGHNPRSYCINYVVQDFGNP